MKKLIQTLIVCLLFVVMGGTASGETLPVGWKTPEGIIPPQCFVREWMSSDNFEAFEEKYSIENNADFRENPGKYIGGKIPFETTLTPWGNDGSKIFLAAPYNLCFKGSLIDGEVENQQKPHVINIDGNLIEGKGKYEGEKTAYKILAKVPLTVCQDLSSNLKGVCKQSFLIALGDYGGGSMGWIYEYSIHGLFSFKDNQQFIVPLKRFEKENEATKFLKITMGGTASGETNEEVDSIQVENFVPKENDGVYEDKNENSDSKKRSSPNAGRVGARFLGIVLLIIGFGCMRRKRDGRFTTGFKNNDEPNYKWGLILMFIGLLLLMV